MKYLCPSIMCANFDSLAAEVRELSEAGADIFHVDIMDGSFVPNYAMGLEDLKCVRRNTSRPIDAHLMVENPAAVVELIAAAGADIIYVHAEADRHLAKTLGRIRQLGKKPGLAVNPGTSLEMIRPVLSLCDYILVMTVNPGFAGQKYLPFVNDKIEALTALKADFTYKILIDGACSPAVIQDMSERGVDGFVLGTSALFGQDRRYRDILTELHKVQ